MTGQLRVTMVPKDNSDILCYPSRQAVLSCASLRELDASGWTAAGGYWGICTAEEPKPGATCRLSCCVAGNQNSTPVEGQLRETLELLAGRHGLPMPQAASPPWLPHGHPHSRIEARPLITSACAACSTGA
jgi:hypothetical protein